MKEGELALAVALDWLLGEPSRAHPVRGMGQLLHAGRRLADRAARGRLARLVAGTALATGGALLVGEVARRIDRALRSRGPAPLLARGLLLSFVLSLRELTAAGARVRWALDAGSLEGARQLLARDLVSRDTRTLDASDVVGAAIQSLADNLNDAVIAPLLYARLGGLGAAYAHRFVNTADALLGYRTPELGDLGWAAARTDDVLGFAPARLSTILIVVAAPAVGGSPRAALRSAWRWARATPSPNGGWPMAAMAGALGVRLEKRGAYTLNPGGAAPGPVHLAAAERLVAVAALLGTLAVAGAGEGP